MLSLPKPSSAIVVLGAVPERAHNKPSWILPLPFKTFRPLEDLEKKLSGMELHLNGAKTKIANIVDGVEFLRLFIRRNGAGFVEVQLTKESIKRIECKIDHILSQPLVETDMTEKLQAAMAAWAGYYIQFNPTFNVHIPFEKLH